jgi:hypothetical protein
MRIRTVILLSVISTHLTVIPTQVAGASFDAYGNLIQLVNDGSAQSIPVNAATNRITLSGSTYDEGGNLTRLAAGGEVFAYEYDGVGAMKHLQSNTDLVRIFIYNAGDERPAWRTVKGRVESPQ